MPLTPQQLADMVREHPPRLHITWTGEQGPDNLQLIAWPGSAAILALQTGDALVHAQFASADPLLALADMLSKAAAIVGGEA